MEGGIYYKGSQIVIPEDASELKTRIIALNHSHLLAGHFGVKRTMERVIKKFWWKNISDSVEKFVRSCTRCQKIKGTDKSGLLQEHLATQVWKTVLIDYIGPLKQTALGNRYILNIINKFSRLDGLSLLERYQYHLTTQKYCYLL